MNWWGTLLGGATGLVTGGPVGGLIGLVVGHGLDRAIPLLDARRGGGGRVQQTFFAATFSVMGRLARADGRGMARDTDPVRAVMGHMELDVEQQRLARRLFKQGMQPGFPLRQVLARFAETCRRRQNLVQMFLEIQISALLANGAVSRRERELLHEVGASLGYSSFDIDYLLDIVRAQEHFVGSGEYIGQGLPEPDLDKAYAVLGVSAGATDGEVKGAYRRLISEHHPDRLLAKGLPEEMTRLATARTQEIKQAWEQVRHARKL